MEMQPNLLIYVALSAILSLLQHTVAGRYKLTNWWKPWFFEQFYMACHHQFGSDVTSASFVGMEPC